MRLRKAIFVLPSMITFSSVFASFYAIILAFDPVNEKSLYLASVAIFYAMVFDGLDGRVARMTKTQSDFGMQLDSLADAVSFGIAPAILVYRWGLNSLGFLGMVIAFVYVITGISRLAKFNVLAMTNTANKNYFSGLPIPLGAGLIIGVIMTYYQLRGVTYLLHDKNVEQPIMWQIALSIFVILISYLMISNIPFRNFKHIKFNRYMTALFLFIFVMIVVVTVKFKPAFTLLSFSLIYVIVNILEELVKFRHRKYHPSLVKDPEFIKQELLEDEFIDDEEYLENSNEILDENNTNSNEIVDKN